MVRRVTIRAKLFAAIALTVIGPVVTIGVALAAFGTLGDHFDDVAARAARQALALDLKFAVTDMNGWQTAYGYDGGRSRPSSRPSVERTRRRCSRARARAHREPRERALLAELERAFDAFMALDEEAWAALQAGRPEETSGSCSAPRSATSRRWRSAADELAARAGPARPPRRASFDDARSDRPPRARGGRHRRRAS